MLPGSLQLLRVSPSQVAVQLVSQVVCIAWQGCRLAVQYAVVCHWLVSWCHHLRLRDSEATCVGLHAVDYIHNRPRQFPFIVQQPSGIVTESLDLESAELPS